MPEYEVLSSSDDVIAVCSLMCWNEDESKLIILKVKNMTGEDGKALMGQKIIVDTTNKEIIPEDIAPRKKVFND